MSDVLPSKLVPLANTLLGSGAAVLEALEAGPLTLGQLVDVVQGTDAKHSFEQIVDTLTLLYAVGLVEDHGGAIGRSTT